MNSMFKIFWLHPMGLKFVSKVFGRGFGGEPFLRKVSPDNTHIYFYVVIPLILQSFIIILLLIFGK